jgi:hypothetical protein
MRSLAGIIGLAVLLAAGLAFSRNRNVIRLEENQRMGRATAVGLNAQFWADPRFREVRVIGYTGHAGFFGLNERFTVTGAVASANDLAMVRNIIQAVDPPGTLICTVAVTPPAARNPSPVPAGRK